MGSAAQLAVLTTVVCTVHCPPSPFTNQQVLCLIELCVRSCAQVCELCLRVSDFKYKLKTHEFELFFFLITHLNHILLYYF